MKINNQINHLKILITRNEKKKQKKLYIENNLKVILFGILSIYFAFIQNHSFMISIILYTKYSSLFVSKIYIQRI
jgi:hypothetical protein